MRCTSPCPLCANSGHSAAQNKCPLGPRSDVLHRVHHKEEERRLRATLAAISKAVRQTIGVRADDLPLQLENIERALWVGPRRYCLMLRLANRPLRLTILPPTNVRFEVMRRNACSLA